MGLTHPFTDWHCHICSLHLIHLFIILTYISFVCWVCIFSFAFQCAMPCPLNLSCWPAVLFVASKTGHLFLGTLCSITTKWLLYCHHPSRKMISIKSPENLDPRHLLASLLAFVYTIPHWWLLSCPRIYVVRCPRSWLPSLSLLALVGWELYYFIFCLGLLRCFSVHAIVLYSATCQILFWFLAMAILTST